MSSMDRNGTHVGSEETVIEPPITPPGKRLTEEERLYIENRYLQIQNGAMQLQLLDHKKLEIVENMKKLDAEIAAKRAELEAKYETPINQYTVQADGSLVPPATGLARPARG